VEGDTESIDGPVHSWKDAVVDIEPTFFGPDGWRSGTYFHLVPVVLHWFEKEF